MRPLPCSGYSHHDHDDGHDDDHDGQQGPGPGLSPSPIWPIKGLAEPPVQCPVPTRAVAKMIMIIAIAIQGAKNIVLFLPLNLIMLKCR